MAVYVDPIREHPPFYDGWTLWCHMIADTEEELHAMAARIGMRREWHQGDHYDLRPDGRARALALGAVEMPTREMARRVGMRRKEERRKRQEVRSPFSSSRLPLTLPCPAKINTFLAVGPPDDRGWHPLRTVFQEIDLADSLTVDAAEEDAVTFSVAGIPERNTVSRMRDLLRECLDVPPLRVHIEKRIPAESGLGGGSSDGAGLMRAILALTRATLTQDEKREIALRVGADVPFFLVGGRARAEGYGEWLEPLPDLPRRELVLARPEEGCPTGAMFHQLDATPREFRDFPEADALYNDFERVAPRASLDLIERLLAHGAADAGLTGSGSVVFGRFDDPAVADRAVEAMRREAPWVHRGRTALRI